MTTLSFPTPVDDKIADIMNNLADNGADDTIIAAVQSAFEHGVSQGVENVFLYNYITKTSILDMAQYKIDDEEISDDCYEQLYAMDESEMFSLLLRSGHNWSVYQNALEAHSTIDLGDIYDDAMLHATGILIDHIENDK